MTPPAPRQTPGAASAAAAPLRAEAEALAARLPALLTEADSLARSVILGEHGRRRPGQGGDFWQFRQAQPGDPLRLIDWRRSARSDHTYVQDREWQVAQGVALWVDGSAAMGFSSTPGLPTKAARARVLALALAILLARGGERVGLAGPDLPPRRGTAHLPRLAELLLRDDGTDYGAPDGDALPPQTRAVLISDCLGDPEAIARAIGQAAGRGVRGVLLQILDPAEESFPFGGRTLFESMGGTLRHETMQADDLRARYLGRLAERKERLSALALAAGWRFTTHHTDRPAAQALLWLHGALRGA